MFIASRPAGVQPSSVGAACSDWRWTNRPVSEPRNMPLLRSLAGGSGCCYKHGAPNGAFRFSDSTAPALKDPCKVQRARAQQFQPKRVHPDFQSLSTFYDASMSPNVDGRLTLSIPRNSLPLSTFHRGSLENFDTLSVNRGPLCDQVARARTTRSATCNDSVDMKYQAIQKLKSRAVEDLTHSAGLTLPRSASSLDTRPRSAFDLSSPVKPSQAW